MPGSMTAYPNPPSPNPTILFQSDQPAAPDEPKGFFGRLRRKAVVIPVLAVLLIGGGGAAAYFGYYMPNKPANIWASALANTGKGYDALSKYAVSQVGSKNKGIKLSGSFRTTGSFASDGSIQGSNDGTNGEFTGSVSAVGVKVSFDTRLVRSSVGTPDVYFKIDGLQGLGTLLGGSDSPYASVLNGINGKWYFIDHTLFDQYTGSATGGLQITSSDVSSILNAVGNAGDQNVFTKDPTKMAFTVSQNVGKEKQDGRSVYHFKVSVNKQNFKSFVTSLCSNLENSSLKKFFANDSQNVASAIGCDNVTSVVNSLNTTRTADVWVDLHTKLVHKIRFTDKNNSTNYFEIGQDYQGGSSYPFSIGFHDKSGSDVSSGSLGITVNTQTNSVTVNGSVQDGNNFTGSLNLTVAPNNSAVNVQAPAGAENIIQLLNDAGFSNLLGGGSSVNDTKRMTDINALQGQVEAYNTNTGYYPTLADLNNASWRSQNLQGLDPSALQDPAGNSQTLAASPAAHVYAYQPTPAGCNNTTIDCSGYTLAATLDDGTPYVKTGSDLTTLTN